MDEYFSSHAIIKALKGSADPPKPAGPSKILIAQHAWESTDIPFPNKDEVLAEWVLSTFSRVKGNMSGSSAVLSLSYWSLLSELLTAAPQAQASRSSRVWLLPLLNRVSVSTITTTFFISISSGTTCGEELAESFVRCMLVLWPLAAARMNVDTLTDCFGAVLTYLSSNTHRSNRLASMCTLVVRPFRQSIGNSSNKKKLLSMFAQNNILCWIRFMCTESALESCQQKEEKTLKAEVYQAGVDILFSAESLKSSQDPLEMLLVDHAVPSKITISQLRIIPMMYKSYVQEMRRHRFAILGSGSNQSQDQTVQNKVRDAGMKAFANSYRALRGFGNELEIWESVVFLLEFLEEANLVGPGLSERTDILNDIASWAVNSLTVPNVEPEKSDAALRILCILSRVDFEIINPLMREIFSELLLINSSTSPAAQVLLHELLDFHSKTRTIPSYLSCLIDCLVSGPLSEKKIDKYTVPHLFHRDCASGSLLCLAHLGEVSRAVKAFLTPGQTSDTVQATLLSLGAAWGAYLDSKDAAMDIAEDQTIKGLKTKDHGDRKSKRRKVDDSFSSMSTTDRSAVSYSLVARVVAVILPSLPFSTLPESTYNIVRSSIGTVWVESLGKAVLTGLDVSSQMSRNKRWAGQIVTAATLRICHALNMCPSLRSSEFLRQEIVPLSSSIAMIRSEEANPELVVELLRSFFDKDLQFTSVDEQDVIVRAMLDYLKKGFCVSDEGNTEVDASRATWNGSSSSLDFSEPGSLQRGALAIWHLILDRWLPIIDEISSPESLKGLAELCLPNNQSDGMPSTDLSFNGALERAMRSAAFWELPNLRDALVSVLERSSENAQWTDFGKLLKQTQSNSKKATTTWDPKRVQLTASTFETLLRAPREYLPRASRPVFFRCALVSDLVVFHSMRQAKRDSAVYHRTRTVIRAWLSSMSDAFSILDVIPNAEDCIDYLAISTNGQEDLSMAYETVTLDLLANAHKQIIRSATHDEDLRLPSLCASIQTANSADRRDTVTILDKQGLLQFIEILVSEIPGPGKLPSTSVKAAEGLYRSLDTQYSTAIETLSSDFATRTLHESESTIRAYKACLVLGRWLNVRSTASQFGGKLLQKLMVSDKNGRLTEIRALGAQIFSLLLEELHSTTPQEREIHLTLVVSSYVLLLGRLDLADGEACDSALRQASRSLSLADFAFVLSLIREALTRRLPSKKELQSIIRLSCVLVGDAPEGALKTTQEHFEECMQIFSADSVYTSCDPDLSLEALKFIGLVCSDKPASIRLLALGPIWSFLAKLLTGSPTHTTHTHTPILHAIASTASTLVRLRRDLVRATLPHLADILRLLLYVLRTPRPQLGARQRALVSDTLPWWVAPAAPPGPEEARVVARLLTGLQAKTVPRTFAAKDAEKEKGAEALAGAFSKHAGPVLGAYVSALGDPLVVLEPAVREALAPGLYALCDAMGEHGRDALMASGLDASGRIALKALWREYEKQRYVGRG
ncbi:hypothetical protein M0805_000891 [Coniferiporia weirii]|nr:hypothetical protein M0805_000891 [Coniferiporia weirii]